MYAGAMKRLPALHPYNLSLTDQHGGGGGWQIFFAALKSNLHKKNILPFQRANISRCHYNNFVTKKLIYAYIEIVCCLVLVRVFASINVNQRQKKIVYSKCSKS
jgi:hypothetical protein